MTLKFLLAGSLGLSLILSGCASVSDPAPIAAAPKPAEKTADKTPPKPLRAGLDPWANPDPFPSTYKPLPSRPTAIVGAMRADW